MLYRWDLRYSLFLQLNNTGVQALRSPIMSIAYYDHTYTFTDTLLLHLLYVL